MLWLSARAPCQRKFLASHRHRKQHVPHQQFRRRRNDRLLEVSVFTFWKRRHHRYHMLSMRRKVTLRGNAHGVIADQQLYGKTKEHWKKAAQQGVTVDAAGPNIGRWESAIDNRENVFRVPCPDLARAAAAVEFDSTVTRTGTAQYLEMCAGLVFSPVFLSQSCSVFLSCDISTVTVLISGSRELLCCFVVWQFVLSRDSHTWWRSCVGRGGASLWFAVFEWYKCRTLVRDHRVAKKRPCRQW